MNDLYTFLIIGTIHSLYGELSPEIRLQHTLATINSVHQKVPGAKIVYVDNSNYPLPELVVKQIKDRVTVFEQMPHNLFSNIANIHKWKSASEANLLDHSFNVIKSNNLLGKRIFKLSGRYKLSDTFDISEYDKEIYQNRYAMLPRTYQLSADNWLTRRNVLFLEQALISFDSNLLDEFQGILPGVIHHILETDACIEETIPQFLDLSKIIPQEVVHVEGIKADGGAVKKE